ncbi:hypothetical protein CDAR_172731 [Caerostris darwini]|uniref:Uncharacterized protein n=1 Tax=Caerostris darwini TaxID=1538125 RepID=A0AAV4MG48_9ARAC|nr:hypothetical protein CDAR_172731 [Caerostris darwini]
MLSGPCNKSLGCNGCIFYGFQSMDSPLICSLRVTEVPDSRKQNFVSVTTSTFLQPNPFASWFTSFRQLTNLVDERWLLYYCYSQQKFPTVAPHTFVPFPLNPHGRNFWLLALLPLQLHHRYLRIPVIPVYLVLLPWYL